MDIIVSTRKLVKIQIKPSKGMGVSTKTKSSHPRGWAFPQNHAAGGAEALKTILKGTNWILGIPRIQKQCLIYDLKNMHDFPTMSCHDEIRSMCCVQINSNMQDGLDKIQKDNTCKNNKSVRRAEGAP